ncbi:MAG: glycoside hydrolase family 2 TIM barrel-domain containing protein, partial [Armatimonadota bacterium]
CRLIGSLTDGDGRSANVGDCEGAVRLGPGGEGQLTITASVRDVHPWTAETPYLYTLRLALEADGTRLQTVQTSVGFREVKVTDGQLCVNGVPVTLRGITTLDIHPELCHATTPEVWERDIRLMKQANANCIRRGWIGTPAGFLDLCDELGMYVIDEAPFSNIGDRMRDPSLYGAFLQRTQEMLTRDKNHPSVIVWSLGNENPYSDNHRRLIEHCRLHDPTRPVVITSQGTRPASDTTLLSWHYPGYGILERLQDAFMEHPEHAVLLTEYGHCLYGSGGGLEDMWPVLEGSRNCAGGTRFDWCDQGVLRPGPVGGTVMDSAGIRGTDGLTGPYREFQPEYFQTKKMYSPVAVSPAQAIVGSGEQSLQLTIENKYDFTNLSALRAQWQLLEDERSIERGRLRLDAPPRDARTYTVSLALPDTLYAHRRYRVDLAFRDSDGHEVDLHQIPLRPKPDAVASPNASSLRHAGTVTARRQDDEFVLRCARRDADIVARFDAASGILRVLEVDGAPIVSAIGPTVGRRLLEHEVRHGSETILTRFPADFRLEAVAPRVLVEPDGVGLLTQAVYSHTKPLLRQPRVVVGHYYALHSSGVLEVRYAVTPLVDEVELTNEMGLRLALPGELAAVQYRGWGPWASYPDRWAGTRLGVFGLAPGDERWTENRSHVEWALAKLANHRVARVAGRPVRTDGQSTTLGIFGHDLNIRCEQSEGAAALIAAGFVSGIGDKFHRPRERYRLSVRGAPTYLGRVFLCPGASDGAALQVLHASLSPQDASRDTDGDGVADAAELAARTNPLVADTDADGLSDGADPEPRDPDKPEPRRLAFEGSPARQVTGTSWVWVEGEDAASVNWERNVDEAKAGATSGGKCLGGFRHAGETAAYVIDLPADLPEACLHLRFAREMGGGRLQIRLDGGRPARGSTLSLPHTGGWGTAMGHWQTARIRLGPLTAGKHLIQLTAEGAANTNLDGFYVGATDLAPSMRLGADGVLRHPR